MSVASKNLYELLGNDLELDPNRAPEPPTKVADKPVQRTGKRNGAAELPVKDTPRPAGAGRGGRQQNFTGSEQAIRDKTAGSANNRSKPTDDGLRQDRHSNRLREQGEHRDVGNRGRGSGTRGYGARGMRGGTRTARDDRHSRTNIGDQEKQAAKGWGAETGEGEFEAEQGGLADAVAEEKDGILADDTVVDENGTPADALPAEPEDKTKSYEQYLAEQLEKKAALNDRPLETRQANEGSTKKFPEGKAFDRSAAEQDFISGQAKAGRQRERKTNKTVLDIDQAWIEAQDAPQRGERSERGRGGGRGGRGRGEGGRGRGEGGRGRGEGRGRGAPRGGRGGERGVETARAPRGSGPNFTDSKDFPSLGA